MILLYDVNSILTHLLLNMISINELILTIMNYQLALISYEHYATHYAMSHL